MADASSIMTAEANLNVKHDSIFDSDARDPDMPHLSHTPGQLRLLYPPLVVPDDEHGEEDFADDDADGILVEGEKISKQIMDEARAHGRRRHLRRGSHAQDRPGDRCVSAFPSRGVVASFC